MTTVNDAPDEAPPKPSKLPLVIGLVLAITMGAGGFFATKSNLLPTFSKTKNVEVEAHSAYDSHAPSAADVAFIPIPEVTISLGSKHTNRHLFFLANLEVPQENLKEITHLVPRILDVFNSYLRAIDPADLEKPNALFTIRAHLLRRVQIIAGNDKINDLLVLKFMLK